MKKAIAIIVLCLCMALTLGACKKEGDMIESMISTVFSTEDNRNENNNQTKNKTSLHTKCREVFILLLPQQNTYYNHKKQKAVGCRRDIPP